MADNIASDPGPSGSPSSNQQSSKQSKLFFALAAFNMVVIIGIGAMIYYNKKNEKPAVESKAENTESENAPGTGSPDNPFLSKLVPLETFLVNLAGTRDKLAKVNIELSVNNGEVQKEIEQIKPKIRDTILVILSSKSYAQVSSVEGKDSLREEIKDSLNLILRRGKVEKVYFTEFLYN